LGFHVVVQYQWQSIDEKNELILWKLKFDLNENIEWYCKQLELKWI
jgi:hypothetical protein